MLLRGAMSLGFRAHGAVTTETSLVERMSRRFWRENGKAGDSKNCMTASPPPPGRGGIAMIRCRAGTSLALTVTYRNPDARKPAAWPRSYWAWGLHTHYLAREQQGPWAFSTGALRA